MTVKYTPEKAWHDDDLVEPECNWAKPGRIDLPTVKMQPIQLENLTQPNDEPTVKRFDKAAPETKNKKKILPPRRYRRLWKKRL